LAPIIPFEIGGALGISAQKVKQYSGATFGVLAYQGLALTTNPTLLANKVALIAGSTICGALASKFTKHEATFAINIVANAVLGAASIYFGHYTFGISALVCTAIVLMPEN
jgi:hypothetical protein